ncbi:TIR-like protein FxsC [Micromonospora sp. HK10]|uniref:TIR-like protein FxsC n=1 Tax=Micromonospora sp. HK10 TaxID=1538294 RepID=UPI00062712F3|nr:TIR-like protein FxsC [Micromonospora sp. HK10]KKK04808.1 hypothetical protein LQ51_16845 [Micromonospora sp. HK10]
MSRLSAGAAGNGSGPEFLFFVSFAGAHEADSESVTTFFKDLCNEVRAARGTRSDDPAGFLSIVSLGLGSDWSEEIRTALGTCQVFLALCSPGYFGSVWCGREWRAFADRLAVYRRMTGRSAPSLLPLPWRSTRIPAHLTDIQHTDSVLPAVVFAKGLFRVMRQTRYRDDYDEFIAELAGLIVETAREHVIPASRPGTDFDKLPSAFPLVPQPRDGKDAARSDPDRGARRRPGLGDPDELPRLHGS